MGAQGTTIPTPWHLWIIGGLLLIFNGMASFDFAATMARFEPYIAGYPQEALDYYYHAPSWMFAMWGGSIFGGLLGAVFLLLRRKIAVPVMAAAWICSVVVAIHDYVNPAPISPGAGFYALMLLVALLVLFYMYWLARRGVLRQG